MANATMTKTAESGESATLSMEELVARMAELEGALAVEKAKNTGPSIVSLSKTDPWVVMTDGSVAVEELSDMYWRTKKIAEQAVEVAGRAESKLLELAEESCPAVVGEDYKTIWYRIGATLIRRTFVNGRRTVDTKRLFAEHPEISKTDYEKVGVPFIQKKFELGFETEVDPVLNIEKTVAISK